VDLASIGDSQGEGLMPNLIHRYLFWTEERGSLHYDVMVTAILLFLFVSPHYIDFKDRPKVAVHASEVLVKEDGILNGRPRFIYQVRADDMGHVSSDDDRRAAILQLVEPISGEVTLVRYDEVKDSGGHIVAYNATVLR
jgi:hypothetical protein